MISHLRTTYNTNFTETKYQAFLDEIEREAGHRASFKIAETPIFVPEFLRKQLLQACEDLTDVLCRSDFKEMSKDTLLPEFYVPGETDHPAFLSVDFGICEDENGNLSPQLIEIQGFPSLFFYQNICANAYRHHFDIPPNFRHLFGGLDEAAYFDVLRRVIIGDAQPENVVLIDIEPHKQNTQIDFWATARALGIKVLCVSELKTAGRDVFYLNEKGAKIGVERIYNRVIFDELLKRQDLKREFYFQNEYNIRWVGHPHWFSRISKHTLPFFESDFVPDSFFLDHRDLPTDLENYVLKPLYSFSGQGVIINPVQADVDGIPANQRSHYILQKKVKYAPVIPTLDEPAKAEVRIMMAWEDKAARPKALTNLVRLSKGEMVGVRYNMGKTWVGGSIGFFE